MSWPAKREIQFSYRAHPDKSAWCSCCAKRARKMMGVYIIEKGKPIPFHFFCRSCSKSIAAVLP